MRRITLGRAPGPVLEVLDLGAATNALWVTGGDGVRRNVLLGYATAQERLDSTDYLGATIGRYANRIRAGRFSVDGTAYQVGAHDRGNSLHGGPDGFDRRSWEVLDAGDVPATLQLVSPDGDQGYPGEVVARVTYTISGDTVRIELSATTDAPTPLNLTNHAYFDLAGTGSGRAREQVLQVPAHTYLPVDDTGIPLEGPPASVSDTAFDLHTPIDHCFLVDGEGLRKMATLDSPATRTHVELYGDQPGLQVYSADLVDGVALESQLLPDTPNRPDFGDAILRPGTTYRSTIEWRFSWPA